MHFEWVWADEESNDKDKPVTYVESYWKELCAHEDKIRDAIKNSDFGTLDQLLTLTTKEEHDVDKKLHREAIDFHRKLQTEIEINDYLTSVIFNED